MKKPKVKYVAHFDFQDSQVKRNYVVAATNKIESICQALIEGGHEVEIISSSQVQEPRFRLYKGERKHRAKGLTAKFLPSFGGSNRWLKKARIVWGLVSLFLYLLFTIRRNETVIVYHSLGYFKTFIWLKKLRRFRLILEVEEIYQDVAKPKYGLDKLEYRMFEAADGYIFPTELLNAKLNSHHKPYIVICGSYRVEPERYAKRVDGKRHVVYAGTFDPRKGGAAAAAAAEFLDDGYMVHICGFGDEKATRDMQAQIEATNQKGGAEVKYEGLLLGEDYIRMLQQSHIGLSTQDPNASFNATSFPSKILSYMGNGLEVVSIDIPAVRQSPVGDCLSYYQQQTPQEIAKAIRSANLAVDTRARVAQLYQEFVKDISRLINAAQ